MRHSVTKVEHIPVPEGFYAVYHATELNRVQKKFTYHPERHNTMFYDEVAHNLNEGAFFAFASNVNAEIRPATMCFTFEGQRWLVGLPQPHDSERDVYICPSVETDADTISRAAHIYADMFVTEYRRFFITAIKDSKKAKGIES